MKRITYSKKSQVIGQIFIYILVMIVVVLVAFLGYKGIQEIKNSAENAQLIKFKTTITSDTNKLLNDYGSIRTFEYNLPSKYYEVCFMDKNTNCEYHLVKSIYDNDNTINVFLLSKEKYVLDKFSISPLKIQFNEDNNEDNEQNTLGCPCINTKNGNFKIKMEGMGDKIKIILE